MSRKFKGRKKVKPTRKNRKLFSNTANKTRIENLQVGVKRGGTRL